MHSVCLCYFIPRIPDGVEVEFDITTQGTVPVGPDRLARAVPRSVRIVVTGNDPYDLDIRLTWDDDEQRLVPDDVRVTRRPDGIPVRVAELTRIRIGQLIATNLAAEVLDSRGWSGIIEDHDGADPAAVDALIYALAHALGGHNPTQTVALARNLQPGSAIKRVMRARELGYLGKATRGRSGGLTNGTDVLADATAAALTPPAVALRHTSVG
jgi:hypothetical protein